MSIFGSDTFATIRYEHYEKMMVTPTINNIMKHSIDITRVVFDKLGCYIQFRIYVVAIGHGVD
jgi:hypothetical protein